MGDAQRHTWGRKYLLRKAVCRLTGHMKTLKNAHNTGFLRLARPGSAGRVVSVWGEKVGRAAPALCLSLLNSPLVNRVLGHSSWSAKPGSTAKYSGIRRRALSLIPGVLSGLASHLHYRHPDKPALERPGKQPRPHGTSGQATLPVGSSSAGA